MQHWENSDTKPVIRGTQRWSTKWKLGMRQQYSTGARTTLWEKHKALSSITTVRSRRLLRVNTGFRKENIWLLDDNQRTVSSLPWADEDVWFSQLIRRERHSEKTWRQTFLSAVTTTSLTVPVTRVKHQVDPCFSHFRPSKDKPIRTDTKTKASSKKTPQKQQKSKQQQTQEQQQQHNNNNMQAPGVWTTSNNGYFVGTPAPAYQQQQPNGVAKAHANGGPAGHQFATERPPNQSELGEGLRLLKKWSFTNIHQHKTTCSHTHLCKWYRFATLRNVQLAPKQDPSWSVIQNSNIYLITFDDFVHLYTNQIPSGVFSFNSLKTLLV